MCQIKLYNILLILLLGLLIHLNLYGITGRITLEGHVYDKTTKQPLEWANISILNTNNGTTTNQDGKYILLLFPGNYLIRISYIGYRSDTLSVVITNANLETDVFLDPVILPGEQLIIYADQNPANTIIKKAIARRSAYLLDLKQYTFNAYSKTLLRIPVLVESKQDTMIAGILETQSDGYWKAPNQYKEVINSRKQTANFTAMTNTFTVGRIPNFNENNVHINQFLIVNPISDNAFKYYYFHLIDTLKMIDDLKIYQIKIIPKSESLPLFKGTVYICDNIFTIIYIDVTITQAFSSVIKNLRIKQKYSNYENKYWLPNRIEVKGEVNFKLPKINELHIKQISLLSNYKINEDFDSSIFDNILVTTSSTADEIDSLRWINGINLPLSIKEKESYDYIENRMKNLSLWRKSVFFLANFNRFDRLPLTSFSDIYRYNRVEGNYLGIGITNKKSGQNTIINLKLGYGFSDKKWKYSTEIKQLLFNKKLTAAFSICKKIKHNTNDHLYHTSLNTLYALLEKVDYYDYFRAQGYKIILSLKAKQSTEFNLSYLNEKNTGVDIASHYSVFNGSKKFRSNPLIDNGMLRSVSVSLNFHNSFYYDLGIIKSIDPSSNFWNIKLDFEYSDKSLLNSAFQFKRISTIVKRHQLIRGSLYSDFYLKWGANTGDCIPEQHLFSLDSPMNDYANFGSLRTLLVKEIRGEQVLTLWLENHTGNYLFNLLSIPKLKYSNFDLIIFSGAGWADLPPDKYNILNSKDYSNKDILYEFGFGLGHPFFRIDFAWRLTDKSDSNPKIMLSSGILRS